jgi:signal transduction histidine kinase
MDTELPATPTLAAVRLARAQRDAVMQRLRPVGLIVLAIALIVGIRQQPRPGLQGEPLGVLLALAALEAGGVVALWMPKGVVRRPGMQGAVARSATVAGLVTLAALVLLVAGSLALSWLQPRDTAGSLGFLVMALAVLRVMPARRDRLIAAAGVAAAGVVLVLAAAAAHTRGHTPGAASVLTAVPAGLAVAIVLLNRRLDRDSYQIERLLVDLERAQDAEVRAVALAERQRLAREMHDVLAHSLSGLALQLEGARLLAAEESADARLTDAIERAHHLARSGLQEARRAIGMLRDDELPGPERLAGLAAEFERDSGLHCKFAVTGTPHPLDPQVRLALYRVAQEALTNILKHAHACRAEVRLCYEPSCTHLAVEDFGPGEPAPVPESSGYGLTGMRERAELLGGRLTAAPTRTGFLVELWVPA